MYIIFTFLFFLKKAISGFRKKKKFDAGSLLVVPNGKVDQLLRMSHARSALLVAHLNPNLFHRALCSLTQSRATSPADSPAGTGSDRN